MTRKKPSKDEVVEEIKDLIETGCSLLPADGYRAALEEIQSYCEIALEALDEDEKRKKRR